MFSKRYIMILMLILSVLAAHRAAAGPLFGSGYAAGTASYGMGFGSKTSMTRGNECAAHRPRRTPVRTVPTTPYGRALNRRVEFII